MALKYRPKKVPISLCNNIFLREKDKLLFPKTSISTDVILVHQCRKLCYSLSPIAPNVIKKGKTIVPLLGQIIKCRLCSKIEPFCT